MMKMCFLIYESTLPIWVLLNEMRPPITWMVQDFYVKGRKTLKIREDLGVNPVGSLFFFLKKKEALGLTKDSVPRIRLTKIQG